MAAASTGGVAEGGAGGGGGAELLLGTPDARAAHRGRPRLGPHGTVCRPPTPALGRQATGPQLHRSQPRATATAHRVSSRSGLYSRRCDKYVLGCFDFAFLAPPAAEQVLESRSNRSCKGVCTCCIYVRVIVCAICAHVRDVASWEAGISLTPLRWGVSISGLSTAPYESHVSTSQVW